MMMSPRGHRSRRTTMGVTGMIPAPAAGAARVMVVLCGLLCVQIPSAYAYRPFNSTDAAVAAKGELELEFGPLGSVVDDEGRFLVVPSFILNIGVADGWEVVVEGRNFFLVRPADSPRRDTLRETAV